MDFHVILKFLRTLAKNNDRAWFEKNKEVYLNAKENFDLFLTELLDRLVEQDEGLAGLNPKKLAFRIYRDVRFSKDKSPYKVHMGAGFSPGGKLIQEPGYYIHIQPGNKSFLAGGLYMPDAVNLSKIRQEIDYNSEHVLAILKAPSFKKYFPLLDQFDVLKTAPKGYPRDHPQIQLLKLKSFIVSHPFTDAGVIDSKFVKQVARTAGIIKPFNDFLKDAIA